MAAESGVVKFDIGNFVLCHRRLCLLLQPFRKGYDIFLYVTRWQSQRLTLVVMIFVIYLSITHPVWCEVNQLKEATIEVLKKEDLDSKEALKLLTSNDSENLGLSVGQKRIFEAALTKLKQTGTKEMTSDKSTPVTTRTLAKDGSLDDILKKIEGAGTLEDSLLALGTTDFSGSGKSPAMLNSTTISRLDNDPHVFLGRQQKAGTKQVYLVHLSLVYSSVMLSLSGVKKLGLNYSRASVHFRRKKEQREQDDLNLELKLAAMKQAHEDLNEFIDISVQIQMLEENLCEYLERLYRIYRWENTAVSKIYLVALLSSTCILFVFPGRYLLTVGVIGVFLGNSGFEKVCRQSVAQYQLTLQRWKKIFSQKYWIALVNASTASSFKAEIAIDATEDDYDEWYDAEQETSLSECESYEDENEEEEDEDTPARRRRTTLFSGLSVVSNFSVYRRKQRRLNCGNCASCGVSFSSVLKKRQYCRHCGDSFCTRCCCKRVKRAVFGATAPAAYEETVLVCRSCYGYLVNKADEMDTDIW